MKRAILAILLAVAFSVGAGSRQAVAQSCTVPFYCGWYWTTSGCLPTPPKGAVCVNVGPWMFDCSVNVCASSSGAGGGGGCGGGTAAPNSCGCSDSSGSPPASSSSSSSGGGGAAASAAGPGGSGGPGGPGSPSAPDPCPVIGKPINLATGNTYIQHTDIAIPGLGGGMALVRSWNSRWPAAETGSAWGRFGYQWRSSYEERVYVGSDNTIRYVRSDGSFWSFVWSSGANYKMGIPANGQAQLVAGNNYWTMTFPNGEQRQFDNNTGWLTAVIDRNGNTTQLSYDSFGRLTTVTDPAGRHLYFSYPTNSTLVSAVASDTGQSASYSYNADGLLAQVTRPDQSTLSFQYDNNNRVTAVLDSQGKVLEGHTYDCLGRGLTSVRANGVESITLSYSTPCIPDFSLPPPQYESEGN